MKRNAWLALAGALIALVYNAAAMETGGNANKVVLSDSEFTSLVAEDAKFLHDALAKDKVDKKLARKVQGAAVMISGCAECGKHSDSAKIRRNADIVYYFAEKGDWKLARQAAAALYPTVAEPDANVKIPENKSLLPYMYYFANERVGGFGVEQEIGELLESKDKMTDSQFARLIDIGTRCAVIGQVADRFGPEKDIGKLTRKNWQAFTDDFRKASLNLAASAASKQEADTRKALDTLDKSCTKCHDVFK
jgi:hypothetical protein